MKLLVWTVRAWIVALCLLVPGVCGAETLTVNYFEYPPYYLTRPDGQASGIIVDLARKIFARAGVEANLSFLPVKRILHDMQDGKPVASLGWFKTPEREAFAKFSRPIYINRPYEVFYLREKEHQFRLHQTLVSVMQSHKFTIGRVAGFSDGPYVDALLAQYPNNVVEVAADSVRLLKMMKAGRFDFILLPPRKWRSCCTRRTCRSKTMCSRP